MKTIRDLRYRIVESIVTVADLILPKDKNKVVFSVGRSKVFAGNIKALFDYAFASNPENVALIAHSSSDLTLCDDIYLKQIIRSDSFQGLWVLMRAGCIIVDYGCCDWYWPGLQRSQRLLVNLWHGIPIKRIGFAENDSEYMIRESKRTSNCIASSDVDRAMMSSCFGVRYKDVLLTGYPRNDLLINLASNMNSIKLNEFEEKIQRLKDDRRLILYAPTFRGKTSADEYENNGIYNFNKEELLSLKSLLKNEGAVLGLRPHLNRSEDLRFIDDEVIFNMSSTVFPDVQVLLRNTDVLISDYSGIWVDYLLLDRPIIGFVYDQEIYGGDRGCLYDYNAIFPGDLAENFEGLYDALTNALNGDETAELKSRRAYAKRMFHKYDDGNSSKRVFEEVRRRIS